MNETEHPFNWLDLIPGFDVEAHGHILMVVIVGLIIIVSAVIARIQLETAIKREDEGLIPDSKFTFRNLFEIVAEKLYALAENVMGKKAAEKYFPIAGTLFVFIFVSNFVGLIPGIVPPTENLNTTLGLGAFVFLYYNYIGIKTGGMHYLKHFLGPVIWLSPLMLVIELISHFFRPVSLALRLRGNIFGDHIVLGVFNHMTPYVIPLVFYGMGLFVSLVQAFVFCLMTMVYISLAENGGHDH